MKEISFFFEKFRNREMQAVQVREVFIDVLERECGVRVPSANVQCKNGVIYLRAHPVLRTELYLKKARIMECLGASLGGKITDVR